MWNSLRTGISRTCSIFLDKQLTFQFLPIRSARSQIHQTVDVASQQAAAGQYLVQVDPVILRRIHWGFGMAPAEQIDHEDDGEGLHYEALSR